LHEVVRLEIAHRVSHQLAHLINAAICAERDLRGAVDEALQGLRDGICVDLADLAHPGAEQAQLGGFQLRQQVGGVLVVEQHHHHGSAGGAADFAPGPGLGLGGHTVPSAFGSLSNWRSALIALSGCSTTMRWARPT
jgi:hypothetical protein